jgi:hypothetical protein
LTTGRAKIKKILKKEDQKKFNKRLEKNKKGGGREDYKS